MKYGAVYTFNARRPFGSEGHQFDMNSQQSLVYMTRDDYGSIPLPNICLPAHRTLLAERLRRGKPMADRHSHDFSDWKVKTARFLPEGGGKMTQDSAFKSKALIGKMIGIEIEYYPKGVSVTEQGRYGPRTRTHFPTPPDNALTNSKGDGSLGDGGRELCRLTWQSRDGRLNGLLGLKIAGKVNKSCGLHIHVDARHLRHSWHDMHCSCRDPLCTQGSNYKPRWTPAPDATKRTAYDTYNRIVSMYTFIKRLVPASRLRNRYCQWKSNGDPRWAAQHNVPCAPHDRYCALNFQAFVRFGTFEFRCQGGSVNTVKIEQWALVCQRIVAWASDPYTEVPRTWTQFTKIFPEPLRSWVILRDRRFDRVVINERSASAHATEG